MAEKMHAARCDYVVIGSDRVAVLVIPMRGSIVESGAPDTREEIHDSLGRPVLWNSKVG